MLETQKQQRLLDQKMQEMLDQRRKEEQQRRRDQELQELLEERRQKQQEQNQPTEQTELRKDDGGIHVDVTSFARKMAILKEAGDYVGIEVDINPNRIKLTDDDTGKPERYEVNSLGIWQAKMTLKAKAAKRRHEWQSIFVEIIRNRYPLAENFSLKFMPFYVALMDETSKEIYGQCLLSNSTELNLPYTFAYSAEGAKECIAVLSQMGINIEIPNSLRYTVAL